jgi:hypothetical protein
VALEVALEVALAGRAVHQDEAGRTVHASVNGYGSSRHEIPERAIAVMRDFIQRPK